MGRYVVVQLSSKPSKCPISPDQSRRCPLCSQDVGKYLMHNIRSKYDYQKYYLAPLRTSPKPQAAEAARADARRRAERRREIEWGRRRRREREEEDELERAIEKRRWVYRNKLYAKVSLAYITIYLTSPCVFGWWPPASMSSSCSLNTCPSSSSLDIGTNLTRTSV